MNIDFGRVSEERVVDLLYGAKATTNSGTMAGDKADWVMDQGPSYFNFRGECKATLAESLGVKRDWLLKIAQEALETNKQPALVVSFVTENGQAKKQGDWVMVPLRVFNEMIETLADADMGD